MHCNICDKMLSDVQIVFNTDLDTYEPCPVCLEIALDAAFSQGFSRPDEGEIEEDIGDEFGDGYVETLDPDSYSQWNSLQGDGNDGPLY